MSHEGGRAQAVLAVRAEEGKVPAGEKVICALVLVRVHHCRGAWSSHRIVEQD